MRLPSLGERLTAARDLALDYCCFADIGADHGRLSTVLLAEKPESSALVADISPLALEKAKTRILPMQLGERVRFAVADGLDALQGFPADTIFILGMGGDTISGILERGTSVLGKANLILGAHTELPLLRKTICSVGYTITRETVVTEGRRHYVLMRAEPGCGQVLSEQELYLGPILMKTHPLRWLPILHREQRFLTESIAAMEQVSAAKDEERLVLFKKKLKAVHEALSHYQQEGE